MKFGRRRAEPAPEVIKSEQEHLEDAHFWRKVRNVLVIVGLAGLVTTTLIDIANGDQEARAERHEAHMTLDQQVNYESSLSYQLDQYGFFIPGIVGAAVLFGAIGVQGGEVKKSEEAARNMHDIAEAAAGP